jgi:hypothetical protein
MPLPKNLKVGQWFRQHTENPEDSLLLQFTEEAAFNWKPNDTTIVLDHEGELKTFSISKVYPTSNVADPSLSTQHLEEDMREELKREGLL